MLNWKKLYELNDNNNKKAGTAFENLVLNYLSCVYSKYSWKNTQSSWDNNRDFISLVLDNIWGEAKYKKDSSSLAKKDVDPTMISGFLDGKIKLVFIITNGKIPSTISDRINETGKKCGFTVVCITQIQLEYWLIAYPEQYKAFFREPLPNVRQIEAVNIENVRLENQLETTFESSYIQPEFVVGSVCNLYITFSCNTELECAIIEKGEYPFQFIETPKFLLSPGVQQKKFLVKLVRTSNEPIVLEFKGTGNTVLSYILDVEIINNKNINLVYSKQELIKIEICEAINRLPSTDSNHLIVIQGEDGYGKTFLMKEMAKDLSCFHVVNILQCESSECLGFNCMKLCQMIMYFNYGDIYQSSDEYNEETKNYYKYLIIRKNDENIIENDILIDIFEGCFDRIIAKKIIHRLSCRNTNVIKKTNFARRHILFMDDVHLLTKEEFNVFKMILQQLKYCDNNSVLIFSYSSYYSNRSEIVPYKLEGLSYDDIEESLKCNFNNLRYNIFSPLIKKIPHYPKMVNELISFIKNNSDTNLPLEIINKYIIKMRNNKLSNFRFMLTDDEKIVMNLILNFPKGINEQLLFSVSIEDKTLTSLCNKGYIIYFRQRYLPCVDFFQYLFKNQQESLSSDNRLAEYLYRLIDKSYIDASFDVFKAQTLLIKCNLELYLQVKSNYKTKMMEYINKGGYKEAMLYGEIFCFDILNDESHPQHVDLDALFYYGIASIHCDAQRRAIEIFTYIKNHSEQNSLLYYRASAELINNMYSRFQIDGILPKAYILKIDIYASLKKIKDTNSQEIHLLRIAYSTCMNRMMMIYFLEGNCPMALEIYNEFYNYHLTISDCIYSNKYNSMLQEWKMDYARGTVIYNLQNSINLESECYDCLFEDIDYRRKVLCKIDILFFTAIQNRDYEEAISKLIDCRQDLAVKGIVSEEMKATIRITYCRLMKYACIPDFSNISLLEPIVEDIYAEIFSAQLESHLILQGRTTYLLNNLLAILYIIKKDNKSAVEILDQNMKLTRNCNGEYRAILEHNYNYLHSIKNIDWYFYHDKMCADTYYLDPRVW